MCDKTTATMPGSLGFAKCLPFLLFVFIFCQSVADKSFFCRFSIDFSMKSKCKEGRRVNGKIGTQKIDRAIEKR